MSTEFSFQVRLKVGEQILPLATDITAGANNANDGVQNGFLFKLDYQPGDLPITIDLGSIIGFIEDKLGAGAGSLSRNPNLPLIQKAFPNVTSFDSHNSLVIAVRSFIFNSTTSEMLFSISVDVGGSDPSVGLIPLPKELAGWLRIETLAISFTATSKSAAALAAREAGWQQKSI